VRRPMTATVLGIVASLALASSALAFDCMNASKPDQSAGVQVVIDANTGEILWISTGLMQRLERGVIGEDGSGLHGLIGLDLNGDGDVDVSTWFGVGPNGNEIPDPARLNGPACRGLTSIGLYFAECLGG
jgi:hypothetical protein